MSLAEDLLWLCAIPSLIGEEEALCDAVQARLSGVALPAPIRRYGDSIVVPLARGTGGPHVVLGGHLDVVRTEHDIARRRVSASAVALDAIEDAIRRGLARREDFPPDAAHAGTTAELLDAIRARWSDEQLAELVARARRPRDG